MTLKGKQTTDGRGHNTFARLRGQMQSTTLVLSLTTRVVVQGVEEKGFIVYMLVCVCLARFPAR